MNEMMKILLGKEVTVLYSEDGVSKSLIGILKSADDNFLVLEKTYTQKNVMLALSSVLKIKEREEKE